MKRGTVILIGVLAIAGLAAALAASILHDGLSARATPTHLEAMMARNARHLSLPTSAREARNPIAGTEESLREARLHFADHCATCHGNDGGGDTLIGRGLYPKPPDLRQAETQKLSDGELFWVIENGVRFTGMPAFATPGAEEDSWKLVLFIRHLPQLTAEERTEMERYNPKGPDDRAEEQEEEDFLNGAAPQPKSDAAHHHH
ncbi:MAG TPA: c-type cytochrome [Candidatus Acidoferrum sp.]|nr:c-type cytochrome [Candidatus Acidoferrum sp.]